MALSTILVLLVPVISAIFFSATLCDMLEFVRKEREAEKTAEEALETHKTAIVPVYKPLLVVRRGRLRYLAWVAGYLYFHKGKQVNLFGEPAHEAD